MCKLCDDDAKYGHEPASAQYRAGEAGANLTDVLCAFRDIAYALQELSNALAPHGHEDKINVLLVSAHDAIDRAAHNALAQADAACGVSPGAEC